MKLSGNGLPENFSSSYVSIKAYMKTLDELQSYGKRKEEYVQCAESCQKEEAKARFIETSQKRKADEVAKSEAKPAVE